MKNSRIKVRVFVKLTAFYWTVLVMVFLNTIIMATNHYKQPQLLTDFQGAFSLFLFNNFWQWWLVLNLRMAKNLEYREMTRDLPRHMPKTVPRQEQLTVKHDCAIGKITRKPIMCLQNFSKVCFHTWKPYCVDKRSLSSQNDSFNFH